MATVQELTDKRANAWSLAQEFLARANKGDEMTAEDEASWTRALADIDSLGATIKNRTDTATLEKRFEEIDEANKPDLRTSDTPAPDKAYRDAFLGFVRGGMEELTPESKQLLRAGFQPDNRAQGVTTGLGGGYTVPASFWAKVTETVKYYGDIINIAEVITTDTGADLPWPTNDDTSNIGARLSENTQISGQDITFGQKLLKAWVYTSKLLLVSYQLLQDTGVDIEAFIAKKAGQRIGRILNTEFTVGAGAGTMPQGFMVGATAGVTAAGAAAITFDDLMNLKFSVDKAYRQGSNVRWAMHDQVVLAVRKLKDSQNRPLWEPSQQVGEPDILLGAAISTNNDMSATIATTLKTVAFGDFSAGYAVRQAKDSTLVRLTERYADFLQVGFFVFGRWDGLVQDASAIKYLTQA